MSGWLRITLIIRLSQPSLAGVGAGAELGKTSTIKEFYAAKNSKKIMQWSPLFIIFKGKTKIAHLLPEQSAHQDDHFLQS